MENQNLPATQPARDMAAFGTMTGFETLQRQAKLLSSSSLVPEAFSIFGKNGAIKTAEQQVYAQANCAIVIEMAARMDASPLMVAQNLFVVYGRPGWSSQFIIASVSASGRFSPLRFELSGDGDEKTCIAWAIENITGERLDSPPVSIGMAKKEGWYQKNGSKWQTMPDLMLRYRAASFFGKLYAPDLLMGIRSREEIEDMADNIIDVESKIISQTKESLNEKFGKKKDPPPAPTTITPAPGNPPLKSQNEYDTSGISKEIADVQSKKSIPEVDAWCNKHFKRLDNKYGAPNADLIMAAAQERRNEISAASKTTTEEDGPKTIICPDSGQEIIKSDCEGTQCAEKCPLFVK